MLRLMRRRLARGSSQRRFPIVSSIPRCGSLLGPQSGELRFDSNGQPSVVALESLLDELRLEGDQYRRHRLMALERFFAIREAERLGMAVRTERRMKTELSFRRERDLVDVAQIERWMNDNDLNDHEFDALMMDEARVRWVHQRAAIYIASCLPEQLRLSGDYPRLVARAVAKDRLLESLG